MIISTRYYTDAAPVAVDDVYLNDQQAELQPLVYKLKIILPHELEDYADYHVIPVARIALDGEKLIFMKSFIPPLINLEASASALSIRKKDCEREKKRKRKKK